METQNIYLENLCSCAEFEKMTVTERENYMDQTFYYSAPFKILARIKAIRAAVVYINATHFLTADNRAIEFKLCHDDFLSKLVTLGSTGYYDKLSRDSVVEYCEENNLHINDRVTCELVVQKNSYEIDKGNLLTFRIRTLNSNITDLEKIYRTYSITYNPHQLYELRKDDEGELKIFVQNNLDNELNKILEKIQEQQKNLSDLQTQSVELDKQIKIKD